MTPSIAALTVIVIVLSSVASLALLLYFLWRVYECGGRADLIPAAWAVRNATSRRCGIPIRQLFAALR